MGLIKRRISAVNGLQDQLVSKLGVAAVMATMEDVTNSNSALTVVSTAAMNEIVGGINSIIENIESSMTGLIDDSAETGNETTWSVDKLKSYVASVDDSIVVSDIDERDNVDSPHGSLIAYCLDTTGDAELGEDEGTSAAYIYVDGDGWKLLQLLKTDIDVTPFVKYTDIVNDLTTGGTEVPLSAEQGKVLKEAVDAAGASSAIFVDSGLEISGDDFASTYTPIGDVIGATAEVEVDAGVWDIVDIIAGSEDKAWTLLPETSGDYDGKTCRITYLKAASE